MANVNYLNRPNTVKVFASDAMDSRYLPIRFGTNRLAAKDVEDIANKNFEYGLESLEGDIQPRDLNSVLKYLSFNLSYLFQQGVAEFSPYQNYPAKSLVQFDGGLWISTKEIPASKHEFVKDPCNPCSIPDCEVAKEPSKENGWCKLVSHCTYDNDLKTLQDTDTALEATIKNLKGVEGFNILPNTKTGALELTLSLSDGSSLTIPMTKFGNITQDKDGTINITNADGSKLELPKYVAEKSLDQSKGFFFNPKSEKWEVDLADLVKDGSGLEVDKNGFIKVKPSDLADDETIHVNANTGKLEIDPNWYKNKVEIPINDLKSKSEQAGAGLDKRLNELETNGVTVHVNKPITGTGKKTDPLNIKLDTNDFEITNDGAIRLKSVNRDATTNLNNVPVLGFSTFFGYVNKAENKYVYGVPADINSSQNSQISTTQVSQLADGENYDFNGYQIASTVQVDQYLIGEDNIVWHRINESGMNTDGSLKNSTNWTNWNRETNVNITVQQLEQVQNDLRSLANRVTSLENILNSFVKLTDASGTISLGYIKP